MKFSILICTYNRHEMLARCLDALILRTDEKPDQIVVVNGGDQRATKIVEAHRQNSSMDIRLVETKNKNLAASRNVGLPHCTGDIVAMTDDDAEVFPDWVTQMKRAHFENPKAGAVGGSVIGAHPDSLVNRIADQVTFPSYPTPREVRTLPGVNISYKRDAIERVGQQDESLFRGEDVDYNWRIKQLGYAIYFDPSVRVLHHHRSTWRAFLNQHYMYGRAYYRVRRKWSEMYCVYPHALRTPKDFFKAIYFGVAIFYEPISLAAKMERWADKFLAYPILLANQVAWRGGMLKERMTFQPDRLLEPADVMGIS